MQANGDGVKVISKLQKLVRLVFDMLSVSLYTDSVFLMCNTFVMSLLGFAFWILAARYYTVADVGLGSVIVSAIGFLAILSTAGFGVTLVRFLPDSPTPTKLVNTCLVAVATISLVIAGIYLMGLRIWTPVLLPMARNKVFGLVVIGLIVFSSMLAIVDAALIVTHKAKYVLAKGVVLQSLKLVLVIPLLWVGLGISVVWCLALLGTVVVALLLLLPRGLPGYHCISSLAFRQLVSAKDYLGASYVVGLLVMMPGLILPILIVGVLGPEQSAFFYIAWMFANVLFSIPFSVGYILFKEGSWSRETLKQNMVRAIEFSLLLLVPAILAVFLFGGWMLKAFGSVYSVSALGLVKVLVLSSIPMTFVYTYCAVLRVTKQMKRLVCMTGVIAVGTLAMSYFLLIPMGIMGTGYAWLAMQTGLAIYAATKMFDKEG